MSSLGRIVVGIVVGLSAVSADTIGPVCDNCFGGIYSLDAAFQSTNGTTETWRITYGVDLSGYNGPSNLTYIGALAAKVSDKLLDSDLVEKPTGGLWEQQLGATGNPGCADNPNNGFVCIAWKSGEQLVFGTSNSIYSWVFDVTIGAGTLKTSDASIKADFEPHKGVLLSQKINVPEGVGELPFLLSASGLFLFWRIRSRPRSPA
jgi:hypothetical protein